MLVALTLFAGNALSARTSSDAPRDLPVPPLVYGITAFCIILALLAVTFAFKSVGKRH
jgi:hypothetical protein